MQFVQWIRMSLFNIRLHFYQPGSITNNRSHICVNTKTWNIFHTCSLMSEEHAQHVRAASIQPPNFIDIAWIRRSVDCTLFIRPIPHLCFWGHVTESRPGLKTWDVMKTNKYLRRRPSSWTRDHMLTEQHFNSQKTTTARYGSVTMRDCIRLCN